MDAPLRHLDSLPSAEEEFTFAPSVARQVIRFSNAKRLRGSLPPTDKRARINQIQFHITIGCRRCPTRLKAPSWKIVSPTQAMLNNTLLKNVSLKIQVVPQLTRKVLFENILFLEVFAGTSSLIIEVRKTNLRGVAVDKGTERAKGPITILDLTMPEDLQFLMDFIRQEALNLCLVHFAPPCGTCSAARKRKLPSEVQAKLKDAGITPPQQDCRS